MKQLYILVLITIIIACGATSLDAQVSIVPIGATDLVPYTPSITRFNGNVLTVNGVSFEIKGFDYSGVRGGEFYNHAPRSQGGQTICECVMVGTTPRYDCPPRGHTGPIQPFEISASRIQFDMAQMSNLNANTVRIYSHPNLTLLDAAYNHGIRVLAGLELPWNVNYADQNLTNQITVDMLAVVNKYKDHPAILAWVMGNEVELSFQTAPERAAYFNYLNVLAAAIKQVDPNHVVGPAIGFVGNHITSVETLSNIDFIGTNTFAYGALGFAPGVLTRITKKGFIITEYTTDRIYNRDPNSSNNWYEDENARSNFVSLMAQQIRTQVANNYSDGNGRLVGGVYEAYIDQPWKNSGWLDACHQKVENDGWYYYNSMDGYEDREFLGAHKDNRTTSNPHGVIQLQSATRLGQIWQ